MTRPGFRRGTAGSSPGRAVAPPAPNAPFSQAQILHLMKTEFSRARRHGYPLACLLLKIDRSTNFEQVTAQSARDTLRSDLGRLVTEKTREHDHLGFVDDDGYLLVLPHSDLAAAGIVAERIRDAFARSERSPGRLTLSVGIAACGDRDTLFFDTLLSQAELALEWAIEAGGDRAEAFRRDRFVTSEDGPAPAQ